ncbi:hypothetical protein [Marivita geojedonensis]|uniref:Phytanoyl-CoA dioxygenase n=1 Tax=Marivita geojedonensis TaxID=1123756 RepID=A0A1X4NKC5_9RHOB|nr:hypothetical protein [Marivita geojedonensis]OSQ50715.1 hypothetical protein MGEO_10845 [Marivita geojedonensis]PRY77128.1 hypothetical protein CLV76_109116 [Marivita geojedonensis]
MVRGWPDCGYIRFGWNADTHRWAVAARHVAERVTRDPAMRAQWLQCEGTWFVGVDALRSDPQGTVAGVPLAGPAVDRIGQRQDLHPAQLSVTYPGYPRPRAGESDVAFRYRLNRDAAHMDGLLAEGSPKRRFLRERHDWILGLPLTETSPGASPLVVWDGSHHILQAALTDALGHLPEADWPVTDITDIYQAARKRVFSECRRISLFSRPGEAVLLNPFLLHGVAPWQHSAIAPAAGRMVAYLRPESPEKGGIWLRQK